MGGADEIAEVYAENELSPQQFRDAEFIAHARADIELLLGMIAALARPARRRGR